MKWNKASCRPLATQVYEAITTTHITISPGKDVPAQKLCGKTFWANLSAAERRWAGRFVSKAVRMGLFGLEQVRQDNCNHWRYRPKQSAQPFSSSLH